MSVNKVLLLKLFIHYILFWQLLVSTHKFSVHVSGPYLTSNFFPSLLLLS